MPSKNNFAVLGSLVLVIIFVVSGTAVGQFSNSNTDFHSGNNISASSISPYSTSTNETLSEGIVTSIVQSSFNYWSPVEDYFVTSMLYLPFATPNFPPLPSVTMVIGQSVSHNSNYTAWYLSLKPNLKWDNGSPLNSTDLWFTMEVYNQEGWISLNVNNITIVNSTTVKITTSTPEPDFFDLWLLDTNTYIMPYQSFYPHDTNLSAFSSNATTFKSFSNFNNIVADGPFVLYNYTVGENPLLFKANPYYYQGPPKMQYLSFRIFSSASSESAAMRSGEISAMWSNAAYNTIVAPDFTGIPDATIHEVEPGEFEAAYFNMHIWPFNTTQFRQALAYLTNRSSINSIVNSADSPLVGYDLLTNSLDALIGLNPSSVNNYSYNPQEASNLLSQLGIVMDNVSGSSNYGFYVYNNSSLPDYGDPVTIDISTSQLGYGDLSASVELSNQWQAAGFKVSITSIASSTIYATADSATGWDVLVWPDPSGYPPVPAYVVPTITDSDNSTAYNYAPYHGLTNYNNSFASNLINLSEEFPINTSQSNQYIRQLAVYVSQVVPVIPLFDGEWWIAVSNSYYWGNASNFTGVYSTQDLLVSTFYYQALYMVHPIGQVSASSNSDFYYIVIGVVLIAAVVIGVAYSLVSKGRRRKENDE
jgi:peptide/nickel transport system substrate-binding protein